MLHTHTNNIDIYIQIVSIEKKTKNCGQLNMLQLAAQPLKITRSKVNQPIHALIHK